MSGTEDFEKSRRSHKPPNSARHPIPTIQQYKDFKDKQRANVRADHGGFDNQLPASQPREAPQAGFDRGHGASHPVDDEQSLQERKSNEMQSHWDNQQSSHDASEDAVVQDTTQQVSANQKGKRKEMKHRNPQEIQREVTDPVTHLPITIRDFTSKDISHFVPDEAHGKGSEGEGNDPVATEQPAKTLQEQARAESSLDQALAYQKSGLDSMRSRFPLPDLHNASFEVDAVYKKATTFSMGVFAIAAAFLIMVIPSIYRFTASSNSLATIAFALSLLTLVGLVTWTVHVWSQNQVKCIWEDAVWAAHRSQAKIDADNTNGRESSLWFSKIIGSIWPLVNPDLFASISDTLEDVMQASLPSFVRMVSVDDIGQGSEPLRILGVNWLPRGAAERSVTSEGKLGSNPTDKAAEDQDGGTNDRRSHNDGEVQQGMEGEEGDFVNLEVAFAYRASRFQTKFKDRVKNAHLYLAFYFPGNIKLPVWVEVKGIVGICRVRLQLTPDPPFVALCTLTFMGQPKVDMTCVPLVKRGLNIMDLPLISNFVQSSIDAALSEYVAPKSISLDLHAMLAGDDFKRDTVIKGILVVRIHRCCDFKAGDAGIPLIRPEGSSDAYISAGFAKFGKPLWSTRVIADDMEPYWDEVAFIPVGPEELDAGESLRIQLWDSDKLSADDDLGRIEIDLKGLMTDDSSNGQMQPRTDPFRALQADKDMPGKCEWSVGYFSKTRLLRDQIKQQEQDQNIKSVEDLKQKVFKEAEQKLRESAKDTNNEVDQQKQDDWHATESQMISDSLPPEEYPSGILSIQIHQIVGLNLQQISQKGRDIPEGENNDEQTDQDLLADSYCTVILDHRKVFQTRTKPKNAAPFFNAVTERFVRDWRTTDLTLAVRDARVHEDDPLIGFVHFNLGEHLRKHRASHTNGYYPLSGGIGYGRVRISLCFRSVQLQLPPKALGWDMGTLELYTDVYGCDDLANNLHKLHLKVRTDLESGRMRTKHSERSEAFGNLEATPKAQWVTASGRCLLLPVQRRYASCLIIEFRNSTSITKKDKVPACSVLWLSDLVDEMERDIMLPIWKSDNAFAQRIRKNRLPDDKCGERMGSLKVRLCFWPGMGRGHAKRLGKRNMDVQNVVQVLHAARDQGLVGPLVGEQNWKHFRQERMESKDDSDDENDYNDDHDENDAEDSDDDQDYGRQEDEKGVSNERSRRSIAEPSQRQTFEPPARTAEVAAAGEHIDVLTTHPASVGSAASQTENRHNKAYTPTHSMADESPISRSQSVRSSKRGSGLFNSAREYLDSKDQLHRQHRGVVQFKGPRTLAWMKHKADKAVDRVSGSFEHKNREPDIETEV